MKHISIGVIKNIRDMLKRAIEDPKTYTDVRVIDAYRMLKEEVERVSKSPYKHGRGAAKT